MDARATLAIAAVVRSVVDSADSTLAVLASPEGVPPERFKALSGFAESAGGTNALFELARLVNQRVVPPVADDDTSVTLWSLVHDILRRSGKPGNRDSAAEDPEYQGARKLIFIDDGSGIPRPSPVYLAYQEMRDQRYCLQQEIGAKKLELSLKAADDPSLGSLEQLITKLNRDLEDFDLRWETEGQRTRIEQAWQIVDSVNARAPQRQWTKWQDMLSLFVNKDTGEGAQTDVFSQAHFAATAISPAGVEESASSWTKMSMTGADIDKLAADLPADLKSRFNPSDGPLDIDSLEFEWTTAGIVRPWLERLLFGDPGWCFQDSARLLSDGADPPSGEWPYLATGVVFVRGVKVAFRPPRTPPPTPPHVRDHRDIFRRNVLFGRARDLRAAPVEAGPGLIAEAAPVVMERRAPELQFARGRFFAAAVAPATAAEIAAVEPQQPAFAMLRQRAFIRRDLAAKLVAVEAASPLTAEAPAEPVADEITILGLMCSRIPRSPNPDPALFS